MKDRDVFFTLLAMVIIASFLAALLSNALGGSLLFYIVLGAGVLLLAAFGLHCLVKSAVKAALREYDEEKAKQNGPQ